MRSLGAGTPSGKDALAGSPSATEEHGTGAGVEGMGEEPAKVSDVSALGRRYTPLGRLYQRHAGRATRER